MRKKWEIKRGTEQTPEDAYTTETQRLEPQREVGCDRDTPRTKTRRWWKGDKTDIAFVVGGTTVLLLPLNWVMALCVCGLIMPVLYGITPDVPHYRGGIIYHWFLGFAAIGLMFSVLAYGGGGWIHLETFLFVTMVAAALISAQLRRKD